jgi:hypothetical protein
MDLCFFTLIVFLYGRLGLSLATFLFFISLNSSHLDWGGELCWSGRRLYSVLGGD